MRQAQRRRHNDVQEVGAWRRWLVLGVLLAATTVVFGRAFELQVVDREFLQAEGNKRAVRTLEVPAHRGAIRDRNGEPLALSAPVESIWAVPSALLDADDYIAPLARLLNLPTAELSQLLNDRRDKQFVYLQRHMAPAAAERVLKLGAPGVFSQREYSRFYPAAEVAGHLVGFGNIDGRGQEGMEAVLNEALSGTPGSRRVIRARDGRIVEDGFDAREAKPGQDQYLSIDLRLQYLAYRELKAAVQQQNAKGGLIVVADPQTGEILAIANQPSFNPNRLDERTSAGARNRAATDVFEPGSTVKPLLVAQALDIGAIRMEQSFDTDPGYIKVGAHTVRDHHHLGRINLATLLAKSSNVGAAMIGLKLGPESVYQGYQRFGIAQPLYSGFPGQALGVMRSWDRWGAIETATASYGYGVSVTALHLVRAYCALANDGLMPQLGFVRDRERVPPQRTVSAETAREVRRLLEGVVSLDGTALRAAVNGYRVAGKTGTVQKIGPSGYADNRHQSVFIGMIPAEQPRLVTLVMIDEPRNSEYYGGLVAAPVFANVMQGAARLLQLAPAPAARTNTAAAGSTAGPQT